MKTEIQKTELYQQFKKALGINDMTTDDNPYIVECCKIAEDYAKLRLSAVSTRFSLTDNQIETIADLFSKRECLVVDGQETEWLLSHAFQLGMKTYRDLLNAC